MTQLKIWRNELLVIGGLATLILISSSLLWYSFPGKFDSPDENANFFLTQRFAQGLSLSIKEPLTEIADIVAPRSLVVSQGAILPGSFLGLILLYGFFGKIFGLSILGFLTPLFSAIGVVAFYVLVKKFFQPSTAILSALLLAVHPAFLYWSARSFFHNALFFDLFVIGLSLLSVVLMKSPFEAMSERKRKAILFGSGLSIGAAVAVRTSEVIWIALVLVFFIVYFRTTFLRSGGWWVFPLGIAIPLIPIVVLNGQLYGNPLSFGYSIGLDDETTTQVASPASSFFRAVELIFPFGIQFETAAVNFWNYGLKLLWFPSLLTLLGIFMTWRSSSAQQMGKLWATTLGFISLWLVVYYGSWEFHDNPDPTKITLGTSYTRYWLPLYAFGIPYAAIALRRLLTLSVLPFSIWHRVRPVIVVVTVLIVVQFSSSLVITDDEEGLVAVRTHTIEYRNMAARVVRETPENAVIIAGRADKVLFPERKVIYRVDRPEEFAGVRNLLETVPVFIYVPPTEALRTVRRFWEERGFRIETETSLSENELLLRLSSARRG